MDGYRAVRVPLEIANEGAGLHVAGQIDHAAPVTDRGLDILTLGRQSHARFAVAIQDRRDHAGMAKPPRLSRAGCRTKGNFQCVAHVAHPARGPVAPGPPGESPTLCHVCVVPQGGSIPNAVRKIDWILPQSGLGSRRLERIRQRRSDGLAKERR